MSAVIFFGEDEGNGDGGFYPGGCQNLTVWPIADAARDAFFANLIDIGTEDFDALPVSCEAPPLNVAVDFANGVTATLTDSDGFVSDSDCGQCVVGRYPVSLPNYIESTSSQVSGDERLVITFSEPVAAFGFYGVDIGDFGGQITLLTNGTVPLELLVPAEINQPGGGVCYYGFYVTDPDELFTEIQFSNTAPGIDFFAFDNMSVGTFAQVDPDPTGPAVIIAVIADCETSQITITGTNFIGGAAVSLTRDGETQSLMTVSLAETEIVISPSPNMPNATYCVIVTNPGEDPSNEVCATVNCTQPFPPNAGVTFPLRMLRRSPILSTEKMWNFFSRFELDFQAGGPRDGNDPIAFCLRYSDDSGNTWSDEMWVEADIKGGYGYVCDWFRLGRGRDRVWEISTTSAALIVLLDAYIDVEPGTH